MSLTDFANVGLVAALILGLVKVLVKPVVPAKWVPYAAIAFGVALSVAAYAAQVWAPNLGQSVLTGIVAGLAAMGAWSGAKHTLKSD